KWIIAECGKTFVCIDPLCTQPCRATRPAADEKNFIKVIGFGAVIGNDFFVAVEKAVYTVQFGLVELAYKSLRPIRGVQSEFLGRVCEHEVSAKKGFVFFEKGNLFLLAGESVAQCLVF